jgi:hypothetical protein
VANNPNTVVTYQFSFEDFTFTYYLKSTITAADVGKAVTIDTTARNAVKLAGAGDPVFGRLETFEDRVQEGMKVGAVSRKFRSKLPTTGTAPAIGDHVVGHATAGTVTTGTATVNDPRNFVVEVQTGYVIVEKF